MILYRSGYRFSYAKEMDSRVRQLNTDVDRLWRLQRQLSPGQIIGGQVPAGGTAPLLLPNEFEGELATACSAPTNGKTAPTTCTAVTWVVLTAATPTTPAILQNSAITWTLVNRDKKLTGAVGKYVRWKKMTLSDGSSEWRITWIESPC